MKAALDAAPVIGKETPMTGLRRTTTALVVATLACSVGGVERAGSSHFTAAASFPTCVLGKQLVVGVSKGWSQFGRVSGVNFALTNRSTACVVMGSLSVQFHGPKGGAIGPIAISRSISHHVIRETFQLVDQIRFPWLQPCNRHLTATRVRIDADGSSVGAALKTPEFLCGSLHNRVTIAQPRFPIPRPCTPAQVNVHLGVTQGAAGNVITPIIVENLSKAACTVGGFPTVQGANGPGGGPIGPPAGKITPRGAGAPTKDLNHTGASATSVYEQANTGDYAPGRCGTATAPGIDVAIMGFSPEYLTYKVSMCTRFNSTGVTRIGVFL